MTNDERWRLARSARLAEVYQYNPGSGGLVRPPADVPVASHAVDRHLGRRSRRTARHAVRAGPRGYLRPRPRRAAREDPAADLAPDALQGVLRLAARREGAGPEHCLRRRLP